jgi:hypothetical protein
MSAIPLSNLCFRYAHLTLSVQRFLQDSAQINIVINDENMRWAVALLSRQQL